MKNKVAFFSLAIVSLCCLLAGSGCLSAVSESPETEFNGKFTIAYSGNVEGYLEPCG
jgi:hypothetical protein